MAIQVERAYGPAQRRRGARYLVDRIWPRGVARSDLELDDWMRDVAPSDRLRHWFAHDPRRWDRFKERYFAELEARPEAVAPLLAAAERGDVTLVFGAKDEAHNNAVALRDYLESRGGSRRKRR
jgi:uncharacterized protein YeaO (DUF488 family)